MTLTTGDDGLPVVDLRFDSLRHLQEELGPYLALEGFFLRGETAVSPSDVIRFRMMLPGDFVLVEGAGVIIWVREAHEAGPLDPFGAAVGFATLSEQGRELVERMVQTHVESGGKQFDLSRSAATAGAAADPDETHVLSSTGPQQEGEDAIRFTVRGGEEAAAEAPQEEAAEPAAPSEGPAPTPLDLPFEGSIEEELPPEVEEEVSWDEQPEEQGAVSAPIDDAYEALKGAGNALSLEAEAEAAEGFSALEMDEAPAFDGEAAQGDVVGEPPAEMAPEPPVQAPIEPPPVPATVEPPPRMPVEPVAETPAQLEVEPTFEPSFESSPESPSEPTFEPPPAVETQYPPPPDFAPMPVGEEVQEPPLEADSLSFEPAPSLEEAPIETETPPEDFRFNLPDNLNVGLSDQPDEVADEESSRDSVTIDRDFSARRPGRRAGGPLLWIAAIVVVCGGGWIAWQQFAGVPSWWPFGPASEPEPVVVQTEPVQEEIPETTDLDLSEAEVAAAVDAAVEAASGNAASEVDETTEEGAAGEAATPEIEPEPTPVPAAIESLSPATALAAVSWDEVDGGTAVVIRGNGSLDRDRVRDDGLSAPPRILIRIRDIRDIYRPLEYQIGNREIERIRFGHHPETTPPSMWVVFDLADEAVQVRSVAAEGDTVRILVGPGN